MKIEIHLNRHEFSYDIYHLIQAFYPKAEMSMQIGEEPHETPADLVFTVRFAGNRIGFSQNGGPEETIPWNREAPSADTKNQLKKLVYSSLARTNGRTLPWGDLSGIRPVKLAAAILERESDQSAAEKKMQELYCVSPEKASLACGIARREEMLLSGMDLAKGYSLYIDIPFCPSICLYCTFGSTPIGEWADAVGPYLAALKTELRAIRDMAGDRKLTAVYMGGGTPTSIRPEQMDSLLSFLCNTFPITEAVEFTVEAGRPDTISDEMLRVLKGYPVTRISINPQTMNQKTLEIIGRRHSAEDVIRAFSAAREAGFDNINMDMIVGLPGEGEAETASTLRAIEELSPDGLTVHSLALKRAARLNLFRERYEEISFENSAAIMDRTGEAAKRMGMNPYYLYRQKNIAGNFENTGYARPGRECLYNILIMEERQTVLGAGCGAASKFVLSNGRIGRAANVKNLTEYLARTGEMITRKRKSARQSGLFPSA